MLAPTVGLLENAASATFWGTITTAFGLTQINGPNGAPLQIATGNGCTAAAFTDGAGNVIITFQGTQSASQELADLELMSGRGGSTIPAFQDAVAFTKAVEAAAVAKGYSPSSIYVTGHSLGGTLAEYVASQTGLPGASFAGSGLPGYVAPSHAATNFVSYVEHGDAFANWSSDGELASIIPAAGHQSHYGQLVMLGASAHSSMTATIASDIRALGPSLLTGHFAQASAKLQTDFAANLATIHGINNYENDIAHLPATGSLTQLQAALTHGPAIHAAVT